MPGTLPPEVTQLPQARASPGKTLAGSSGFQGAPQAQGYSPHQAKTAEALTCPQDDNGGHPKSLALHAPLPSGLILPEAAATL